MYFWISRTGVAGSASQFSRSAFWGCKLAICCGVLGVVGSAYIMAEVDTILEIAPFCIDYLVQATAPRTAHLFDNPRPYCP